MPIEIKELVIRATVEREQPQRNNMMSSGASNSQVRALKDRIDQLMKMINERNER
ncbi:DUF5908 family protein [Marinigracilibium pacificum]|uniref:Uncharacterized protein n=1 Tax=Marinigracilibium pacificum TaxID=2729599 RepID=A0A848J5N8_9BACT|nr:DUF5908 family protein [Marinigracilibium pacificum]NMM49679.1 hypothetical protein [Marinigracilibium pacificum]